ncbi:MAG: hypothetical protein IKR92_06045 [Alphaproteobacteria bacterium]|nr:hypothetical protein [Alphaproteobacteria bacterium]
MIELYEDVNKFLSQQITEEEFISVFKQHCGTSDKDCSYDFKTTLRTVYSCDYRKKCGYEDYKKLVSAFDKVVYKQIDSTAPKDYNRFNSLIFEGYCAYSNRASVIAANALVGLADNHINAVVDFYNEQNRKVKESAIERYGWYDGHFNYEYGFVRDFQMLARQNERNEENETKLDVMQRVSNKIQELKEKNKTSDIDNIPHTKTQILREVAKDNIGKPKRSKDAKRVIDIAIKCAIRDVNN